MKNDIVLQEAGRLHALGWAVLWLHPKAKNPIESGWTKGPGAGWDYLKNSYREGNNVGVRLGEASKIGENYLACIDVDIKHATYRETAEKALYELIGFRDFPEVYSGSGNGSRHLYCVTAAPFKMVTYAKHEGWEICIYSNGRQMVLPPSIHPNGQVYKWERSTYQSPPLIDVTPFQKEKSSDATHKNSQPRHSLNQNRRGEISHFNFSPLPHIKLDGLPISNHIRSGILRGENVTDRSAFLLQASQALVSAGLTTDEVLTILTDPSTYLGKCGYEHAKTSDRVRAAAWVYRYTLKQVEYERNPRNHFEKVDKTSLPLLPPENTGFYFWGPKGKLIPNYGALLEEFKLNKPFKTIADMKAVYVFNGTHYVNCSPIEIKAFAEEKFEPKPEDKLRAEFYYKVLANNVMNRNFFTDSTMGKINFQNGVLDLTSSDGELLGHSPDFGFRGVLPYGYDPEAQCPIFKKWLHGVMLGDHELMAVLQEFMGYIVRGGDYKYHKALWLGGVGRNGKSTFVDLLKALIGIGNFSVLSIKALVNDKFISSDLDGKIANFSEETSPQELADSGPFKNLTGDGDLSAQKKYGDPYSFRNRAKLVMTYNQIPDLKDLSPGMLSRPLIVPFQKIIGENEQDRNIKKKLFSELPGIFNFALEGWIRLEEQEGFTKSSKSEKALQTIREESCNVYQWVENRIEAIEDFNMNSFEKGDPGVFRPIQLYDTYCRQEKYTFKAPDFYRRLNRHPLIKAHKKEINTGVFYIGLKVR